MKLAIKTGANRIETKVTGSLWNKKLDFEKIKS